MMLDSYCTLYNHSGDDKKRKENNKKNWCDCFEIKMLVTFHPQLKCAGMCMRLSVSVNCELIVAEHRTLNTYSILQVLHYIGTYKIQIPKINDPNTIWWMILILCLPIIPQYTLTYVDPQKINAPYFLKSNRHTKKVFIVIVVWHQE